LVRLFSPSLILEPRVKGFHRRGLDGSDPPSLLSRLILPTETKRGCATTTLRQLLAPRFSLGWCYHPRLKPPLTPMPSTHPRQKHPTDGLISLPLFSLVAQHLVPVHSFPSFFSSSSSLDLITSSSLCRGEEARPPAAARPGLTDGGATRLRQGRVGQAGGGAARLRQGHDGQASSGAAYLTSRPMRARVEAREGVARRTGHRLRVQVGRRAHARFFCFSYGEEYELYDDVFS
jgi:hypothetical protein